MVMELHYLLGLALNSLIHDLGLSFVRFFITSSLNTWVLLIVYYMPLWCTDRRAGHIGTGGCKIPASPVPWGRLQASQFWPRLLVGRSALSL